MNIWSSILAEAAFRRTFVFHYLQPDVDWHNRVLFAVQEMQPRPLLIADAGFYVRGQDERPGGRVRPVYPGRRRVGLPGR